MKHILIIIFITCYSCGITHTEENSDNKNDILVHETNPNITNEESSKLFEKAKVLIEQQDYKSANKLLLKCDELEPNNPTILNTLGISYFSLGEYKKALKNYYLAIEVDSLSLEAYASAGY